ncbi:MAG: Hsp20/alpha crystallin family protein [Armatimonadetes bacterium]|nr:Hsp20/alpha crystallin family protein [Armatimonadota bacterium]
MKTIVRNQPFTELDKMEALFDNLFRGYPAVPGFTQVTMPLDVFEKEGFVWVRASLPGIDPEHIEVTVENNNLTIKGTINREEELKEARVYRREIATGAFTRTVRLGEGLDLDKIVADFDHGIVTVKVPRMPEEKPHTLRVPIKSKALPVENKKN